MKSHFDLAEFNREVLGEVLPPDFDLYDLDSTIDLKYNPEIDCFAFEEPDEETDEIVKLDDGVIELIPKQIEAANLLASQLFNFILYGGAIRGGKTVWGLLMLLMMCEMFPRSRWAVIRKNSERIRKTTIPSFESLGASGVLRRSPFEYTHPNGSVILFIGENFERDPELDSFKGLEVNGFLFEELNECQYKTFNKAFERAGTWKIGHLPPDRRPAPIILGTCNPTQSWVKEKIYNLWKNNILPQKWAYVPALAHENPHIDDKVRESWKNLPWYEYEVFVNGNWDLQILTSNAFFHAFNFEVHVRPVNIEPKWSLFVSIDSNVLPYCTATLWQFNTELRIIRQVDEITAKSPNNWAGGLAKLLKRWLKANWHHRTIYIVGDATTKNQTTIDENKRSFFDVFRQEIGNEYDVQGRIKAPNPSVAATAEFTNAILGAWDNWSITIGEHCKESVSDYMLVQKADDNTMLKKKVKDDKGNTFEPNGHISDTFRYVLYTVLKSAFSKWKVRSTGVKKGVTGEERVGNYEE